MATEALYPTTVSSTFDQVPGERAGDLVADNVGLSPFPLLAQEVIWDFSTASLDINALWRDFFALTGRLRTFNGSEQIVNEWEVAKKGKVLRGWKMDEARVSRLTPTSSWIDVSFTFIVEGAEGEGGAGAETERGLRRNCFGILSFVPGDEEKGWKVWMLRTMLENFEGYGHPDDATPIFSKSLPPASPSTEEDVFEVIIIGAGQAGLSLAGRLNALGIKNLLLDKESEVGSS
jgi:hypothetical protein